MSQYLTIEEFKNEPCTFCGFLCYGHFVYFTKKKSRRSKTLISEAIPRCKECIILQKELQRCTEKGRKIRDIIHEDEVKGKDDVEVKEEEKEKEKNTTVEGQELVVKKQKAESGKDD